MINIIKRLKNLELLDEAIANENDEWGNTPEEWEVHLEILVAVKVALE
nr:13747_t:CDS:2 [Entrophospora candida]